MSDRLPEPALVRARGDGAGVAELVRRLKALETEVRTLRAKTSRTEADHEARLKALEQ